VVLIPLADGDRAMKPSISLSRLARGLLGLAALVCATGASATGPVRAYYWNVGDGAAAGPATDAARIARFRAFGVTEVHLWLNENRATPACGYLFQYQEGGGKLWTAARLEQTTRAMQAAGLKVVYILSPDIRTQGYIDSLAAPGGPLEVAGRIKGVDIELDIEGNGATATPCSGDGLSLSEADTQLLKTIRAATPTSKIVASTTRTYELKHPILMEGADAISPQLYESHYASPLDTAAASLAYYRKKYPAKPLWIALSVECSVADSAKGLCSQALFESEVKMVSDANVKDGAFVPKYVIWGEREASRCPGKYLCSVFAQDYLTATASP
jgi:hypothetical protein